MLYLMPVFFLIAILAALGPAVGAGIHVAPYILFGLYLTILATALLLGMRRRT